MFVIIIVYIFHIRLKLFEIFLSRVGVKHLYSKNLSIIATISSLNITNFFPACFSCINNFLSSHNSLKFSERKTVFNPDASIALLL